MKNQALFSSKDKSKKLKCRLLQFLFGALRVKLLFGRVCPHMLFQVAFMGKTLPTILTNERFLSSMGSNMKLKARLVSKNLATVTTLINI